MLKPVAFWDASVLVTLCVNQTPTPLALVFESKYRIAVWWATHVEIASALVRSLRQQDITAVEYAHARQQAEGLANLWDVIAPSAKVARDARTLLERYPLRAADALQLAAALEWCEGEPKGMVFLTFDRRLREAAALDGFTLESLRAYSRASSNSSCQAFERAWLRASSRRNSSSSVSVAGQP